MKKLGKWGVAVKICPNCRIAKSFFLLAITVHPLASNATEGGAAAFPPGGEDFAAALMPPPGWYGELLANRYRATTLKGDNGGTLPVAFNLKVLAMTSKLVWIKPVGVLGADNWGTVLILPTLDIDVALSPAPGVRLQDHHRGFADIALGNALHWTFPQFQMVNALDLVFPTGTYNKIRLANPGQNRAVFRLVHAGTWLPAPAYELSYRLNWDHHRRNTDTSYLSGQLLNVNYAVGWKPQPNTVIGLAGYLYRQLTDDELSGQPIGNRMQINAVGVAVKHFFPTGQFLDIKWYRESGNRNTAQGNAFWIYAGTRF